MARTFDGSTQAIYWDTIPFTAPAFSVNAWFKNDGAASFDFIWWLGLSDAATNDRFVLRVMSDNTIDHVVTDGGTDVVVQTTETFTDDVWSHAHARAGNTAARNVVVNGGTAVFNNTTKTPDAVDRMAVGSAYDDSPGNYFPGDIAELVIYSNAKNPNNLAAGISPLLDDWSTLIFYAPMVGDDVSDITSGTGGAAVEVGSPGYSDHPEMLRPKLPQYPPTATGAAPASNTRRYSLSLTGVG